MLTGPARRLAVVGSHLWTSRSFDTLGSLSRTTLLNGNVAGVINSQQQFSSSSAHQDAERKRETYKYFVDIQTRWMDNDQYGHVNNTVYYSYFDTVINKYLIEHGGLVPYETVSSEELKSKPVGLAVETKCQFYQPLSFPDVIEAGLLVKKIGKSSVIYQIGIFNRSNDSAAAVGRFAHVFVDRVTRKPASIPDSIHKSLQRILE